MVLHYINDLPVTVYVADDTIPFEFGMQVVGCYINAISKGSMEFTCAI